MKTYDNNGKLIAETNTVFRQEGGAVTTNTVYNGDRVVYQHISVRDNQGKIQNIDLFGGKLIP